MVFGVSKWEIGGLVWALGVRAESCVHPQHGRAILLIGAAHMYVNVQMYVITRIHEALEFRAEHKLVRKMDPDSKLQPYKQLRDCGALYDARTSGAEAFCTGPLAIHHPLIQAFRCSIWAQMLTNYLPRYS